MNSLIYIPILNRKYTQIIHKELLHDESEAWESHGRSSVSIDIAYPLASGARTHSGHTATTVTVRDYSGPRGIPTPTQTSIFRKDRPHTPDILIIEHVRVQVLGIKYMSDMYGVQVRPVRCVHIA